MKNKLTNKKGITLIALVITIIVLLILAGLSIIMISNQDGILNRAISVKEKNYNASEEEKVTLALMAAIDNNGNKDYSNIGKYLKGASFDDGLIKYNENNYLVNEDGTAKKVTWYVTTNSEGKYVVTNGKGDSIQLGSTVNYDPYTGVDKNKLEVESKTERNGCEEQKYVITNNDDKSQKLIWKVLGTDDNGDILIMPTTNVTDKDGNIQYMSIGAIDTITGRGAVQYGAEEVNRVCSIYGYGNGAKYARSIQVEDIDKLTGFDKTAYKWDVYKYGQNIKYTNTSWGIETDTGNEIYNHAAYKSFTYFNGNTWITLNRGESAILRSTTYCYDMSIEQYKNVLINKGVYDLITKDTNKDDEGDGGQYYWLGSSFVHVSNGYASFGLRLVGNSSVDRCWFLTSNDKCTGGALGLRPVVALKSDVLLVEGENDIWNIK